MADAQKLVDFMNGGGSLYIEGAKVGTGSNNILYPYLGLGSNSVSVPGYSLIESLHGAHGTALQDLSLTYLYGSNADYGIDILDADVGQPLMKSQEENIRVVSHDAGGFRSIASSTFFGAMADGTTTKANVMAIYLDFLEGTPVPNIASLQTEIDFGIQFNGYPVQNWVNLINDGIANLEVYDITIQGDVFFYAGPAQFQLDPMETINLEITQNAAATGFYEGSMIIMSNDPDTPQYEISLSGSCLQPPQILVDPSALDISLDSGEIHEEFLTISNTGGYNLSYSMVVQKDAGQPDWLSADHTFNVVSPASEDVISLTFDTQDLQEEYYEAEIVVYHDDPAQAEVIIPVTLNLTMVDAEDILVGAQIILKQNYPNPFNPETKIAFELASQEQVTLEIFNSKGQVIDRLVDSSLEAGNHFAVWNGRDNAGKDQASGLYYYRLKTDSKSITRKMILLR